MPNTYEVSTPHRSTRTIFNIMLETAKMFNSTYVPIDGTLINSFFDINSVATEQINPYIGYYMLGFEAGHNIGTDNRYPPNSCIVKKPVPLLAVPTSVGYSPEQASNYALRKIEIGVDGVEYMVAYAKKMDVASNVTKTVSIYKKINGDGTVSFTPTLTDDAELINFAPTLRPKFKADEPVSKYLGHSSKTLISFETSEAIAARFATDVMLGTSVPLVERRQISDIGLIQGVKGVVDGLTELHNAQLAFIIKTCLNLDEEINEVVEPGGLYPVGT